MAERKRILGEDKLTGQSGTWIGRAAWAGTAVASAVGIDFVTKWAILNLIMAPPRTIEITPFLNLTLGFNTGISFGMFSDLFLERPLALVGIKVLIIAGLLAWAMRTEKLTETIGLGLIAGGAAGNVVDRLREGAVTDFLDFHVGDWHWPAFNMADVMISVGCVLLIAGSFWPARSGASSRVAGRGFLGHRR